MVQPSGIPAGGQQRRFEKPWLLILASGCVLAGLMIGFLVGANRSIVTIRSCRATAAPTQATAMCSDGWFYSIPVDNVEWRDASGSWHQSGRPDCIPLGPKDVTLITFATVDVRVGGIGWRPVVWVSC